jgi:hypothetical protein
MVQNIQLYVSFFLLCFFPPLTSMPPTKGNLNIAKLWPWQALNHTSRYHDWTQGILLATILIAVPTLLGTWGHDVCSSTSSPSILLRLAGTRAPQRVGYIHCHNFHFDLGGGRCCARHNSYFTFCLLFSGMTVSPLLLIACRCQTAMGKV